MTSILEKNRKRFIVFSEEVDWSKSELKLSAAGTLFRFDRGFNRADNMPLVPELRN